MKPAPIDEAGARVCSDGCGHLIFTHVRARCPSAKIEEALKRDYPDALDEWYEWRCIGSLTKFRGRYCPECGTPVDTNGAGNPVVGYAPDHIERAGLYLAGKLVEFLPAQHRAGVILPNDEATDAWWQKALAATEEAADVHN